MNIYIPVRKKGFLCLEIAPSFQSFDPRFGTWVFAKKSISFRQTDETHSVSKIWEENKQKCEQQTTSNTSDNNSSSQKFMKEGDQDYQKNPIWARDKRDLLKEKTKIKKMGSQGQGQPLMESAIGKEIILRGWEVYQTFVVQSGPK